jgi:hypothetical protein
MWFKLNNGKFDFIKISGKILNKISKLLQIKKKEIMPKW